MKKMHILLVGAVMVIASPVLAEDKPELRYQNDNARASSSAEQQTSPVNYADYTVNDDDHGDERSILPVSADNNKPAR